MSDGSIPLNPRPFEFNTNLRGQPSAASPSAVLRDGKLRNPLTMTLRRACNFLNSLRSSKNSTATSYYSPRSAYASLPWLAASDTFNFNNKYFENLLFEAFLLTEQLSSYAVSTCISFEDEKKEFLKNEIVNDEPSKAKYRIMNFCSRMLTSHCIIHEIKQIIIIKSDDCSMNLSNVYGKDASLIIESFLKKFLLRLQSYQTNLEATIREKVKNSVITNRWVGIFNEKLLNPNKYCNERRKGVILKEEVVNFFIKRNHKQQDENSFEKLFDETLDSPTKSEISKSKTKKSKTNNLAAHYAENSLKKLDSYIKNKELNVKPIIKPQPKELGGNCLLFCFGNNFKEKDKPRIEEESKRPESFSPS